ncbi:MAG: GNAT family N-acetyltransferase [Amnibacterium sp.]
MIGPAAVLRDDDPRTARLLAEGWRVAAESWGARLRLGEPPDLGALERLVARARRVAEIAELGEAWAPAIAALESETHEDFPQTPATPHVVRNAVETAALWQAGFRAFGAAVDGRLVAATLLRRSGDAAETEVTTVHPKHRRLGLGAGVKAASILALAREGVRAFGTGGAAENEASLAMNRAVGYVIEERWLSLVPPGSTG